MYRKKVDPTYFNKSLSTISSMLFNWKNINARCCDTTGSVMKFELFPSSLETPIPQSNNSCLY